MKKLSRALLAVAALAATPAFAQQGKTDWDKIVLEDKAGNVMTSTGGDYQTAEIGKLLVVGENMMLSGEKEPGQGRLLRAGRQRQRRAQVRARLQGSEYLHHRCVLRSGGCLGV